MDYGSYVVTDVGGNYLSEVLPYLDAKEIAEKLAKENGNGYHILDLEDNTKISVFPNLEDYMRAHGYEPE